MASVRGHRGSRAVRQVLSLQFCLLSSLCAYAPPYNPLFLIFSSSLFVGDQVLTCIMRRHAITQLALAVLAGASDWDGPHVAEEELRPGLPCPSGPRELQALWQEPSYDHAVRPHAHPGAAAGVGAGVGDGLGAGVPTQAWATIFPKLISEVDTKEQHFTIDVDTHLTWTDWRLAFNDTCLVDHVQLHAGQKKFSPEVFADPTDKLWTPRLQPTNLYPLSTGSSSRIVSSYFQLNFIGQVEWSVRHVHKLQCAMDFSQMPDDEQQCHLRLRATQESARVQIETANYSLMQPVYESQATLDAMSSIEWRCNRIWLTTEQDDEGHDYINLQFSLQRRSGWYTSQVVVPMVLLVIVTWSSFFINRAIVPARVVLSILSFLTLNNMASSITAQLPRISYAVRLLQLLSRSNYFIFVSILVHALANWLMRIEARVAKAVKAAAASQMAASTRAVQFATTLRRRAPGQVARAMFARHAGGDAFIDQNELVALCAEMGRELSDEQIARVLAKLDTDGDGKVGLDEFLKWFELGLSVEALLNEGVSAESLDDVLGALNVPSKRPSRKVSTWKTGPSPSASSTADEARVSVALEELNPCTETTTAVDVTPISAEIVDAKAQFAEEHGPKKRIRKGTRKENSTKKDIIVIKATLQGHLSKADHYFINSKGEMRIRDQDLDIFMRYAFLIGYAIVVGVYIAGS